MFIIRWNLQLRSAGEEDGHDGVGRRRRRGREGEVAEDEEPDPARQDAPRRRGRQQALHGARHRRSVLLQQRRHDRHQDHRGARILPR